MTFTTSEFGGDLSGSDPPPLVVAVTEEPSTWVIDVRGELDLFTFPFVRQHLDVYKDTTGNEGYPRRIVFSLPELEFIDASGLRALLTAVDGHGLETITIRNPSSQVRRLLELVDLDSMIEPKIDPIEGTANSELMAVSSGFLSVDLLECAHEVAVLLC